MIGTKDVNPLVTEWTVDWMPDATVLTGAAAMLLF